MTACDGDLLTSAGEAQPGPPQPDSPAPARVEPGQARADRLRLRAGRARDEALALQARSEALRQTLTSVSRQELLTRSVFARVRAQLATMPVIEQAKGVLMFQQGCDADEAFALLRQASQRSNVPVRVLAERIVSGAQRGQQPEQRTRAG